MNEKQVTLITIAVLAVVLLGGGAAVWYLQFKLLQEKEIELADVLVQVGDAERKKSELPKLQKEVKEELEPKEADEILKIPNFDIKEYDNFIDTVDLLRNQSNVFVTLATYVPPKKSGARQPAGVKKLPADVHKVDYDITCTGAWFPILRFLNLVETQKRFIEIQSCSISSGQSSSRKGAVSLVRTLKLRITTYTYLPPPAKDGKKDAGPESVPILSTPLP